MRIERSNEPEAFTAFERQGWAARIGGYELTFARLTSQTVGARRASLTSGMGTACPCRPSWGAA